MADFLIVAAILGNTTLCFVLIAKGQAGRLQWLLIMTGLSVLVDAAGHYIHGFYHHMYGPLRILLIYWLFNVLLALCIFEAYRARIKWLEWILSVQLLISLVALFAHQHGDKATIYFIEMFNVWVNMAGIIFCIYRFSRYNPA